MDIEIAEENSACKGPSINREMATKNTSQISQSTVDHPNTATTKKTKNTDNSSTYLNPRGVHNNLEISSQHVQSGHEENTERKAMHRTEAHL